MRLPRSWPPSACPTTPLLGRYRVPSEKTLRSVLGRLDPAELSAAGFAYLTSLLPDERPVLAPLMPDGGPEREQRRAHRAAARADPVRCGRQAIAVDGKCLRGARRRDGSRVFVLSAVRHGDGITLAARGARGEFEQAAAAHDAGKRARREDFE